MYNSYVINLRRLIMSELFKVLDNNHIKYDIKTEYHIQIKKEKYIYNIYPTKRTIYINGATKGIRFGDFRDILKIINQNYDKPVSKEKSKRSNLKWKKEKLWKSKDKIKCFVCGKLIEKYEDCTIEHKIPLGLGGSNRFDNLALSHKECNQKKGCSM